MQSKETEEALQRGTSEGGVRKSKRIRIKDGIASRCLRLQFFIPSNTCGHLQQAVSLCIKRPLQLQHIVILLRVHELVREEHIQSVEIEPHGATRQAHDAPSLTPSRSQPSPGGVVGVGKGGCYSQSFFFMCV